MAEKYFHSGTGAATVVGQNANYHRLSKFVSAFTGKITKVVIRSTAPGNIKYSFYTDNAGAPDSLLSSDDTSNTVAGGNNTFELPIPFDVVASSAYWLGMNDDTTGAYTRDAGSPVEPQYFKAATFAGFVAPGTISAYSSASGNYLHCFDAIGWEPPALTSIDGDNSVLDNQTGVAVVGTDFMDAGDTLRIVLSDSATWGAGTEVDCTVTVHDDTSATIDIVSTGLSAGTVYAYAVTALGQVSDPLPITLVASGNPLIGKLKKIMIFESILSDNEIKSLSNRARIS